jgi:CTD small phosphatase-like protein 2
VVRNRGVHCRTSRCNGILEYADWVLDQLDTKNCVKHRLYRQHSMQKGNFFLKDLSKLGRDLSKVIIVDNVAENFQLHPHNGIFIKSWFDDPNDNALSELLPILVQIAKKGVTDVRAALRDLKEQMIKQILKGNPNPHLNLNL